MGAHANNRPAICIQKTGKAWQMYVDFSYRCDELTLFLGQLKTPTQLKLGGVDLPAHDFSSYLQLVTMSIDRHV